MPFYDIDKANVPQNHWTKFFKARRDLSKCFIHARVDLGVEAVSNPDLEIIRELAKKTDLFKVQHPISLVTYLGFKEHPVGLLLRSLCDKEFYHIVYETPSYYVSKAFGDWAPGFAYGKPIVLVEGALDAEALVAMSEYPFVIAYLTSSVPTHLCHLLSVLTDKVVIIPDTDHWGVKNLEVSKRNLKRFGVHFSVLKLPRNDIDVYDFFEGACTTHKDLFKQRLQIILQEGTWNKAH